MGKLADKLAEGDLINFGPLPDAINALLQQGVALYYDDRPAADGIFRQALNLDPSQLPTYYCLYKIHTYQKNLDAALDAAQSGLAEAARQCGLSADWREWRTGGTDWQGTDCARFMLYTLKALAFIRLRRNELETANQLLATLSRLDPTDSVGGGLVAEIAAGLGDRND